MSHPASLVFYFALSMATYDAQNFDPEACSVIVCSKSRLAVVSQQITKLHHKKKKANTHS